MPVEFLFKPDDKNGIYYRETPYLISQREENLIAETIKKEHLEDLHTKGWNKDKSLRYAGSIPWHIWWGKIQESGNQEYWREDNCRRAKQFFNENSNMRVGDDFRKPK